MIVKTHSLAGEFVHVDVEDPALDRPEPAGEGASDVELKEADRRMEEFLHAYQRAIELGDLAALPLRSGQQPVLWRFRHLKTHEIAWVMDSSVGGVTLQWNVLSIALVGLMNATDEAGKPVKLDRERNGPVMVIKPDQLDALLSAETGRPDIGLLGRLANRVAETLNPRKG